MKLKCLCAFALLLASIVIQVRAEECNPPAITANAGAANMFTPEQEMILGDLVLESLASDFRFVRDEKIEAFLDAIGRKLIKHLPPTGLNFKFHIIDYPEANAFNIPGGHVFVSRKLIAFAANEDELAGVVAHELGHATVHHGAIDMTATMRRVLNIQQVGDKRDIAEKFNRMIENARRQKSSRGRAGHENEQQLEADKIGLFAMVAAGYDPEAFTSLFDRLTESEGKTGSWFSDLFGNTRPAQKRLREMIKLSEQLPAACRDRSPDSPTETFLKWQADTTLLRGGSRSEVLPGLVNRRELAPKMRSDVTRLQFSRDGNYLLVQDDFGVSVLTREPFKVAFQIAAEDVLEASFTPDGGQVVFVTSDLRFERWDVATQKPLEVREIVTRGDCLENRLSPDGRVLACVNPELSVRLIETATGRRIFEKKNAFTLDGIEVLFWRLGSLAETPDDVGLFRIEFSPDSRYFVISRSEKYRFSFSINMVNVAGSENAAFGLDVQSLKPLSLDGDIKKLTARPYVFLDPGRILGSPGVKLEDAGIFSFPDGKRLDRFPFAGNSLKRTENPDYFIVKPIKSGRMGVFDIKRKELATGLNKADAAVWNDYMAYEGVSGKILLQKVKYLESEKRFQGTEVATADLTPIALGTLRASAVSDSFRFLALSSRTRGGVWDLETGERKFFVRGFNNAIVAGDGAAVAEFPKFEQSPRSLVLLNPKENQAVPIREFNDETTRQFGRFLLERKSLAPEAAKKEEKKDEKKKDKKDEKKEDDGGGGGGGGPETRMRGPNLSRNVRFELTDFVASKSIWTRDFPKEAPNFSLDEYSGRIILYWRIGLDSTTERLRDFPELQAIASKMSDAERNFLIEVVDAYQQKTIGAFLLDTGNGSFGAGSGLSERDWALLRDSEGRVLLYSIATGQLIHRFFGRNAALNPTRNLIAIENFPGELSVYSLDTGEKVSSVNVDGKIAFARFNLQGDRLFVLSDAQTAYTFDLAKMSTRAP